MNAVARQNGGRQWQALGTLHLLRCALAVLLTILYFSNYDQMFFGRTPIPLFGAICLAYLTICVPITVGLVMRRPGLEPQLYGAAATDILIFAGFTYAAGGVASGLGMLLITLVAGASLLTNLRMAVLLAAIASIAMLLQELYLGVVRPEFNPLMPQAGILGAVLITSAWAANALANRLQHSEAIAARRQQELADLARLNQHIIQQMALGVLVVDSSNQIRLHNTAATLLLGREHNIMNRQLREVAPELRRALARWRNLPRSEPGPVTLAQTGRSILPRFARLGIGQQAECLIMLEDAERVSEQAQQMKLAALGQLTANIAHEIRNPLSAIRQAGQLLHDSARMTDEEHHLLDIVERHTHRINGIIEDVLDLSRPGSAVPEIIHLRPWLQQVADDYVHSQPQVRIAIDLANVDPNLTIRVDRKHLLLIINNLWDNSRIHGASENEPLRVTLSAGLSSDTEEPWLEIADNGPGIRAEVAEQMLEPFFTTARSGTGLGLYIVRELCIANHAQLSYRDAQGGGACFRLDFIRADDWLGVEAAAAG